MQIAKPCGSGKDDVLSFVLLFLSVAMAARFLHRIHFLSVGNPLPKEQSWHVWLKLNLCLLRRRFWSSFYNLHLYNRHTHIRAREHAHTHTQSFAICHRIADAAVAYKYFTWFLCFDSFYCDRGFHFLSPKLAE